MRKFLKVSVLLYLTFGAGVVFGAVTATLVTLAITGLPEAQEVYQQLACEGES